MFSSKCDLSSLFMLNICYLVFGGLNKNVIQLVEHEHLSLFIFILLI